ncbi:hypothetical protein P9209_22565 [Prescottella defluvii]|nr:hypothetical protein P9209_22565 [Prescottella defluvii]
MAARIDYNGKRHTLADTPEMRELVANPNAALANNPTFITVHVTKRSNLSLTEADTYEEMHVLVNENIPVRIIGNFDSGSGATFI